MPTLVEGLKKLNHLDPGVETFVQATGEHVIMTAGEVHLERCLYDLKERFAKVPFTVSEPIVTFREALSSLPKEGGDPAPTQAVTANKACTIVLSAHALPAEIFQALSDADEEDLMRIVDVATATEKTESLREKLLDALNEGKLEPASLWGFGPRKVGSNILVTRSPTVMRSVGWKNVRVSLSSEELIEGSSESNASEEEVAVVSDTLGSISTGFQLATASGPLCGEPMTGVLIVVEDIKVDIEALTEADASAVYGPFSGQLIAAVKEGCHKAYLASKPRLTEPFYKAEVHVSQDFLGATHAVLSKRRGKIVDEDVSEATYNYTIQAALPVVESFGISDELRKKTSGAAGCLLKFSHWEMLEQDPFYKPETEEELEEWGEYGDKAHNLARRYMDMTRRRKGLRVEEQVVMHAEKQRTISRKK